MKRTRYLLAAAAALCSLLIPAAAGATGGSPARDTAAGRISVGKTPAAAAPAPDKPAKPKSTNRYDSTGRETVAQAEARTDLVARMRSAEGDVGTADYLRCRNEAPNSDGPDGVTLDHFNWCKITTFTYVSETCTDISNPATCTEIGRVRFRLTLAGEGNQGSSTADRRHTVTVILDQPVIVSGAPRMSDQLVVAGRCTPTTGGSPMCSMSGTAARTLGEWMQPATSTAWITYTSPEGSHEDGLAFYTFGVWFGSETDQTVVNGSRFRCDSATYLDYSYGCVYPDVTEVFDLTVDSEVKESAEFIWRAQNQPDRTFPVSESAKSIPGSVASGRPLRRTTVANKDGNRTESVKQCRIFFGERYTRDSRDCDEYPFASTAEGSKTGGTGTAHYAVQPLNSAHNQKAGSRLDRFYNDQRILRDEDSFYTRLVDPDGSAYGGPPAPPSGVAAPVVHPTCSTNDLPEVKDLQTKVTPEPQFLDYARTTANGWTGGDSTYSFRLPDGRELYLFSDTFLGPLNADGTRPLSAKLINSSFVVRNGSSMTTIHGGTVNSPKALMPPAIDNRWYWLGDGMVASRGGTDYLQVMFQEYRGTNDGSALPFAFVRNVVATFALDDLTKPVWIDPLPSDTGVAWGSALLPASRSGDGYTYVYGVSNDPVHKKMHIARVRGSDLTNVDDWQFLKTGVTGDSWMHRETEGSTYLSGVANEYSVTPWRGQFVLISQNSTEAFSNKIRLWSGCDPYSFAFWVDHDVVYEMPETGLWGSYGDADVFAYNAHAHPILQDGDRWVVSYNVNSFDNRMTSDGAHYRDPSIYKPRFISFRLVPAGVVRAQRELPRERRPGPRQPPLGDDDGLRRPG
ncbi:hypothetical protein AB0M28_40300, partial [Streptomyces sp. NPDC051940]|uniref:NucA/NucB deoxyribonuclease domain-containing protein n=1 Tax=Streptomyces sp. NPDC051940 TaxID=3155675 RepID=UPI00344773CF